MDPQINSIDTSVLLATHHQKCEASLFKRCDKQFSSGVVTWSSMHSYFIYLLMINIDLKSININSHNIIK